MEGRLVSDKRRPFRAGDGVDVNGRAMRCVLDEHAGIVFVAPAEVAQPAPVSWLKLFIPATDHGRIEQLKETLRLGGGLTKRAQALLDAEPKPRLTLADVVALPPSGWSIIRDETTLWLDHAGTGAKVQVEVEPSGMYVTGVRHRQMWPTPAQAAKTLRAVAELLEVLAEVSSE